MNGRHSENAMLAGRISTICPVGVEPRRVDERAAGDVDRPLPGPRGRERAEYEGLGPVSEPARPAAANPVDVIAGRERGRRAPDRGDEISLGLERGKLLLGDLMPDQHDPNADREHARGDRRRREVAEDPALKPHAGRAAL